MEGYWISIQGTIEYSATHNIGRSDDAWIYKKTIVLQTFMQNRIYELICSMYTKREVPHLLYIIHSTNKTLGVLLDAQIVQ